MGICGHGICSLMQKTRIHQFYFNGKNALPINQFINLVGGTGVDGTTPSLIRLYALVSWLYRGVSLRENLVSGMPFEIRRGRETIYQFDPTGSGQDPPPKGLEYLVDIPFLSGMVEGASVLRGKAYLFNVKNNARTLEIRWFKPDTITPDYDQQGQVSRFVRDLNGKEQFLETEDVLHFWVPDKFVENGPALHFPGQAALAAADVLYSMDEFLKGYFDRGMVRAGFLKYKELVQPSEQDRIKEWWNRLTQGVRNAFNNLVVRGDFDYVQIGEGLKELENVSLTESERESIATALGIPQSKMTQPPGGLGDTKTPDDIAFVTDTGIPECNWISRVWNKQFFIPQGMMMVYTPQKLAIFQEDEVQRSQAAKTYYDMGYSRLEIEDMLGIYVPEEIRQQAIAEKEQVQEPPIMDSEKQFSQIIKTLDELKPPTPLLQGAKAAEIERFKRWVKKREGGRINPDDFKTNLLTTKDKINIVKLVQKVRVEGEVPPSDFGLVPTEEDIQQAFNDWDERMPAAFGLLDAETKEEND